MSMIKKIGKFFKKSKGEGKQLFPLCDTLNEYSDRKIESSLKKNLNFFKEIFADCSDVIFREFVIGEDEIKAAIIYTDGMVERACVNDVLLNSLMFEARKLKKKLTLDIIKNEILIQGEIMEIENYCSAIKSILSGDVFILFDGFNEGISTSLRSWESRSVTEPSTEPVIRGSREGFSETLRVSTSLLRRRIITPKLKIETEIVGKYTNTDIAICYIKGLADENILRELRKRLQRIEIDGIFDSGYIEELIEDNPHSPFPSIISTERSDRVAGSLLEGQIAILVNNSSFALILPVVFSMFFVSPEDYFTRYMFTSAKRILRYISFFLSLLSPALYVAITTYHQAMIPTPLLISLSAQREGVPFPAIIEALLMTFLFQILLEAGLRMPRPFGQAISIVGALIIGEAAVNAGLVAAAMVIVIAITAIASLTFPSSNITDGITVNRIIILILSSIAGLYGIMLGLFLLLTHLNSLRSFGIPYLSPLSPSNILEMKDTFIRVPWWMMQNRPAIYNNDNIKRQKKNMKPDPLRGVSEDED